jgi:hypothetical protein
MVKSAKEPLKVEAMEYFMNDVFQNHLVSKNHLDTKINWLLGISGLIMSILLPYIAKNDNSLSRIGLLVMAFVSMITFFICLLSFELPKFLTKNTPEEYSVMFYSRTVSHTSESIYNELKKITSYDDLLKQYSITLYNLTERNIKIKNRLFKYATYTLFCGLSVGFVIIIISLF